MFVAWALPAVAVVVVVAVDGAAVFWVGYRAEEESSAAMGSGNFESAGPKPRSIAGNGIAGEMDSGGDEESTESGNVALDANELSFDKAGAEDGARLSEPTGELEKVFSEFRSPPQLEDDSPRTDAKAGLREAGIGRSSTLSLSSSLVRILTSGSW